MLGATIINGDCREVLKTLEAESVHCCVTSPPYWGLRDYGCTGQLGLEATPEEYTANLVRVFQEVRRVLRGDGTLWLNLGDSYSGSGKGDGGKTRKQTTNSGSQFSSNLQGCIPLGTKPKDLIGIPWRVAFALQADGWWLRQDLIWHKPNPMPESVTDRCTKAHEYIFLLSKSAKYYFDADAIKEPFVTNIPAPRSPSSEKYGEARGSKLGAGERTCYGEGGRNKRSVWSVLPEPLHDAHFATFPTSLIRPCIQAGCPKGGMVLDPFNGAGTTGIVAKQEGCEYTGIELNTEYVEMSEKRLQGVLC